MLACAGIVGQYCCVGGVSGTRDSGFFVAHTCGITNAANRDFDGDANRHGNYDLNRNVDGNVFAGYGNHQSNANRDGNANRDTNTNDQSNGDADAAFSADLYAHGDPNALANAHALANAYTCADQHADVYTDTNAARSIFSDYAAWIVLAGYLADSDGC